VGGGKQCIHMWVNVKMIKKRKKFKYESCEVIEKSYSNQKMYKKDWTCPLYPRPHWSGFSRENNPSSFYTHAHYLKGLISRTCLCEWAWQVWQREDSKLQTQAGAGAAELKHCSLSGKSAFALEASDWLDEALHPTFPRQAPDFKATQCGCYSHLKSFTGILCGQTGGYCGLAMLPHKANPHRDVAGPRMHSNLPPCCDPSKRNIWITK
jgi:hypothetical protein